MKIDEFLKALEENGELKQKFEAAIKSVDNPTKEAKSIICSKIANDLGFDVAPSEFQLKSISSKELSDDELAAVTGGVDPKNKRNWPCVDGASCRNDFEDTSCWSDDYCSFWINDYKCDTRCYHEFNRNYDCAYADYCDSWESTY